ncbi:cytochrome P450 [Actinomadura opuntiae]|uniref:cytochrome P450 n=1 Tax=Actinomadura sp. OS1-43 TaxID=604315 RepID=UPI00255AB756|nr:cytochrome P450 [Actinomadura sp. OS1-43]MDL4821437.1 cytochrome P450 [Actinomadura sp. OS1-43]
MANVGARAAKWLVRGYIARKQRAGFNLESIRFLPNSTLAPLRRDGLDPVSDLTEIREARPVSRLPLPFGFGVWLVTGYEAAKAVLADADSFSNDLSNLVGKVDVPAGFTPGGLGFSDPPVHTRRRKLLTPEFTMRRLSRLTPLIHTIVEERLDAMADATGPVDLMEQFALPVPLLTICELLGVSHHDRSDFQRLSSARFDLFGGASASVGAISESMDYLLEVVRRQRAEPGPGLIGMLIREHGDELDDLEIAGLSDGVLTGGLETTASMLALGSIVLLRDREQFQRVHDDDQAIGPFVDELLRYLTVVQLAFPRFARKDTEVAGVHIAEGDVVLISLSAANRDPALGDAMDGFDAARRTPPHLAFGWGAHRCIGAELAKMELRAAYPALVRRFPDLRLAVEPDRLSYRKLSIVYGVNSLPVHLG